MTALAAHDDVDLARDVIAPRSLHVRCSAHEVDGAPLTAMIEALSKYPHDTHVVDFDDTSERYGAADWERAALGDGANTITSRISSGPSAGKHTIMLDVDVPVRVVPSSTPGHSHVYIDVVVGWEKVRRLLDALADAHVIERGYADASIERGCTRLRLPWIKKGKQ